MSIFVTFNLFTNSQIKFNGGWLVLLIKTAIIVLYMKT